MTHVCKEHVAGIHDAVLRIQWAVLARIDPAPHMGGDLLVHTCTVDCFRKTDGLFLQGGHGHDGLKRGARGFLGLGRIVEQRQGHVVVQLIVVFRIHCTGKLIVVIAGIRHQGPYLSRLHIGHHASGRTGIQGQLGRGDLNIRDLLADELEGILVSVGLQHPDLRLIVSQDILGIQGQAQLLSCDRTAVYEILIDPF